jgi:predicted transcriptional regulator
MNYQQAEAAGLVDSEAENQSQELLRNCQRILRPVKVINPFAEKLQLPLAVFKPRRTNSHYLQFIAAITFYHQQQRESKFDIETGEEYIETNLEDIEAANRLLKEVLLRKSDELSGACRNYFECLKAHLSENNKDQFQNREIRKELRISGTTLRRYHKELLEVGLIQIKKGKPATGFTYQVIDPKEYEVLQAQVSDVLDQTLEEIKAKCASKPVVSHQQNGSPKKLNASEKKVVSQ